VGLFEVLATSKEGVFMRRNGNATACNGRNCQKKDKQVRVSGAPQQTLETNEFFYVVTW
jgi:hypothetical protein